MFLIIVLHIFYLIQATQAQPDTEVGYQSAWVSFNNTNKTLQLLQVGLSLKTFFLHY